MKQANCFIAGALHNIFNAVLPHCGSYLPVVFNQTGHRFSEELFRLCTPASPVFLFHCFHGHRYLLKSFSFISSLPHRSPNSRRETLKRWVSHGFKGLGIKKPKEQTGKGCHRGEHWDCHGDTEPDIARHRSTGRIFTFLPHLFWCPDWIVGWLTVPLAG